MESQHSVKLLIGLASGVFISHAAYAFIQESITKSAYGKSAERFHFFAILLFCQCFVNACVAKFVSTYLNEKQPEIPEREFAVCGFTYIGAMFASNFSLKFISYPVQVVGKSIKPIPVMLLSVILAKKKYPFKKYVFISMISLGVMLFMYNPGKVGKATFTGFGEALLLISLLFDGFTGGIQESLRKYNVPPYILMLHMNLWSLLYMGIAVCLSMELRPFIAFASRHPVILPAMFLFGLLSALGQVFLFSLVTKFGPLMCSVVTTSRKFFTVLASIVIFSHVMTTRQWIGTALVFTGIFCDQLFGKSHSVAPKKAE